MVTAGARGLAPTAGQPANHAVDRLPSRTGNLRHEDPWPGRRRFGARVVACTDHHALFLCWLGRTALGGRGIHPGELHYKPSGSYSLFPHERTGRSISVVHPESEWPATLLTAKSDGSEVVSTPRKLILGTSPNPGVVPLVRPTREATIAIRAGAHKRLREDGTAD